MHQEVLYCDSDKKLSMRNQTEQRKSVHFKYQLHLQDDQWIILLTLSSAAKQYNYSLFR